jgi:hypothetical protein
MRKTMKQINLHSSAGQSEGVDDSVGSMTDRNAFADAIGVRKLGRRAAVLVACRESDEYDRMLFDAMCDQTYRGLRGNPWADAVRRVGLRPLDEAQFDVEVALGDGRWETFSVQTETRISGRTKATLFWVGNTAHLWCMASAAKVTNEERVNDFNRILMDLIREIRPREIHVATISRLMRSQGQAGLLLHACSGNVDAIVSGEMRIDLVGPGAAMGQLMFQILGMIAAQERDWIMHRLIAGRLAIFNRGQWFFGRSFIPFGYKYNQGSKTLVVDEDLVDVVPRMLEVLASERPSRHKQTELSRLGVTMRRSVGSDGRPRSLRFARSASASIDALLASASVWVFGEYLVRHSNPDLSVSEIAGVEIVRSHDRDPGELQLVAKLPVPDGGWAPQSVLDRVWDVAVARAAELQTSGRRSLRPLSTRLKAEHGHLDLVSTSGATQTTEASRHGGRAKDRVAPFSGRRWTRGGLPFELAAVGEGRYRLRAVVDTESAEANHEQA